MNFIEDNGKKVAALLCVASCFPVIATVYAMETRPGWHGDKYLNSDTTIAKGWQEIEGKNYYFSEEDGTVDTATTQQASAASVSSESSTNLKNSVIEVSKTAVEKELKDEEEELDAGEEQAAPVEEALVQPSANVSAQEPTIVQASAPVSEILEVPAETPAEPVPAQDPTPTPAPAQETVQESLPISSLENTGEENQSVEISVSASTEKSGAEASIETPAEAAQTEVSGQEPSSVVLLNSTEPATETITLEQPAVSSEEVAVPAVEEVQPTQEFIAPEPAPEAEEQQSTYVEEPVQVEETPVYVEENPTYEADNSSVNQTETDPIYNGSTDYTVSEETVSDYTPEPEIDYSYAEPEVTNQNQYGELNTNIVASAKELVGVTDGQWCTEVVQQALANAGVSDAYQLWPDEYAAQYGYYTDTPEAGNLIYYNNGGRGVDHIAIYIGDGEAVHGNYLGQTVIASAYIDGAGAPQFIQVQR